MGEDRNWWGEDRNWRGEDRNWWGRTVTGGGGP